MTKEEVKHDLEALIEYFNSENEAIPMCLEYCLNMIEKNSPCDLCRFNPPSSGDGKPCSMCLVVAKESEE